jgi:hypothetical protein
VIEFVNLDLSCCLWLNVGKVEWVIYVTDVGQQQHFDMFFKASTKYLLSLPEIFYRDIHTSSFLISRSLLIILKINPYY